MREPGNVVHVLRLGRKGPAEGETLPFTVRVRGKRFHGFVIRKNGRFHAYQNLCRHLPITLDLEDGKLLNYEGTLIQCQMHGALYEIETGLCVGGPCEGASLIRLSLRQEEERLVISFPESLVG